MVSYDFHGPEAIHCMVERRKGGETGVEWLQTYRGGGFWSARQQGVWLQALVNSALCRSSTLAVGDQLPAAGGSAICSHMTRPDRSTGERSPARSLERKLTKHSFWFGNRYGFIKTQSVLLFEKSLLPEGGEVAALV